METMSIGSRVHPVIGGVQSKRYGVVPLVDAPMMTDYKWQKIGLEDRLQHPEVYREILGEDVAAVCAQLSRWLEEHKEEVVS